MHTFVVVFILEDAGQGCLHDGGVHQDDVEDSLHGSPVVLLGLFASVDDDPSHSPSWSKISFGQT